MFYYLYYAYSILLYAIMNNKINTHKINKPISQANL